MEYVIEITCLLSAAISAISPMTAQTGAVSARFKRPRNGLTAAVQRQFS